MMFLVIWIGFEDLDLIGFDSLQVDWIWIWIVASRDWIDSKNLDWIFGFFQSLVGPHSGLVGTFSRLLGWQARRMRRFTKVGGFLFLSTSR